MANNTIPDHKSQPEIEIIIPEDCFTRVSNQAIRDKRLDKGAFHLLCWLASHVNSYKTSYSSIVKQANIKSTASVSKYFKQLEQYGYLQQVRSEGCRSKKIINWLPSYPQAEHETNDSKNETPSKNEVVTPSKNEIHKKTKEKDQIKKENNKRKKKLSEPTEAELEVFSHWVNVIKGGGRGKLLKFSDKRLKAVRKALDAGYPVADLKAAIDGNAKDIWHQKNNVNDLEYICRNEQNIDRFRDSDDVKIKDANDPQTIEVRKDQLDQGESAMLDGIVDRYRDKRDAGADLRKFCGQHHKDPQYVWMEYCKRYNKKYRQHNENLLEQAQQSGIQQLERLNKLSTSKKPGQSINDAKRKDNRPQGFKTMLESIGFSATKGLNNDTHG